MQSLIGYLEVVAGSTHVDLSVVVFVGLLIVVASLATLNLTAVPARFAASSTGA